MSDDYHTICGHKYCPPKQCIYSGGPKKLSDYLSDKKGSAMKDYEDYLHQQYGSDLDGENDQPEDEPTITVSGNHMTIYRLDEQGNPTGEPIELGTVHGMPLPVDDEDAMITDWDMTTDRTLTLEVAFKKLDPKMWRLLTGQPYHSRWVRIKRWFKRVDWEVAGLWSCGLALATLLVTIIGFALFEWVL